MREFCDSVSKLYRISRISVTLKGVICKNPHIMSPRRLAVFRVFFNKMRMPSQGRFHL